MQVIRGFEQEAAALVGWGLPVLLLSTEGEHGTVARRLAGMGAKVDVVEEMFSALSEVIDDPAGYELFVVDCDGVGGLDAAQRAVQMLGEVMQRVPVILVSQSCQRQQFPEERLQPTILRAPLSAVSMKVGFEHALRDRLIYLAA